MTFSKVTALLLVYYYNCISTVNFRMLRETMLINAYIKRTYQRTRGRMMKKLIIDFLYLDLSSCERCQDTDRILDEVLSELGPNLRVVDYLRINKIKMTNKEDEKKYGFKRSPTIKLNGRDVEEIVSGRSEVTDNYCSSCSDVCGEDTDCRTYEYGEETSENVPKEMLKEGLLKVLCQYDDTCCAGNGK